MAKKKYQDDFPERAKNLAREGLLDKQIAEKLGIKPASFYTYQLKYPEFLEAIKEGKKQPNIDVEAALFKSATGFEYEEVTKDIRSVKGADGKEKVEFKHIKSTTKYYPPVPASMVIWLKNRARKYWKDKFEAELSGPDGGAIPTDIKITFADPAEETDPTADGK